MKESTGSVAQIYIVIFFIVIIFGLFASISNYYKAYKINNAITGIIDDYGGFNVTSLEEIEKKLNNYGYKRNHDISCNKNGLVVISGNSIKVLNESDTNTSSSDRGYSGFCVNIVEVASTESSFGLVEKKADYMYYYYRVKTVMGFDFSYAGLLSIPIESKTSTMYSCYGENCLKYNEEI